MKTRSKKMILAAATIALIAGTGASAEAGCGGGGGGHRGGISFGFGGGHRGVQIGFGSSNHHHHSSYAPVQHRAPVYNTAPVYSTPVYNTAPVYQNAPVTYSAPIQQSVVPAPQPIVSAPAVNRTANQSGARPVAPTLSSQPVEATESSALAMLASINDGDAKTLANQIPDFGAAVTASSPSANSSPHVGTWAVSLPGNQSVKLELTANGSFTWTATKDGKSSNFTGQYRLESNRLVLVRSNDLQKMEGDWTTSASGFTFKVDGETSGGLSFSRS